MTLENNSPKLFKVLSTFKFQHLISSNQLKVSTADSIKTYSDEKMNLYSKY